MDNLTRRGFVKLGLTTAGTLLVGPKILKAMELKLGGEDYIYLRWEERKPVPFSCINCESRDGALAFVNTENNRIVKIEGNPIDVSSRGRCCPKGSAGFLQTYDPDRIIYPLKRVGERGEGKWKRVSWDEAIDEIAGKISGILDKGKASEIFFHTGRDTTGGALKRFVDTLGSPNLIKTGYGGDINKRVAMKATWGAELETPDFSNSKYILVFGSSIYETSPTRAQRVTEGIIENRAKMVVFDVRASNTAGKADEWHPLFPGTDGLVALAMAHVIIEEGLADKQFVNTWTNYSLNKLANHLKAYTPEMAEEQSGVPAKYIRRIAIEFATHKPATIFTFRGTSSHFYGTYHERACMLLPILTGNIDIKGGYCLQRIMTYPQPQPVPSKPEGESLASLSSEYPLFKEKGSSLLPFLIRDGKEKVSILFNYMSNPAYSSSATSVWHDVLKDEKLVPLIIDFSPFMSETASLADLILPEASYLERYDPENAQTVLWPSVGLRQPIIKPLGDSRETRMVLQEIIHKVDPEDKKGMKKYWNFKNSEEWMRRHVDQIPALKKEGGLDFLRKNGVWPLYGKLDSKTRKIVDKRGEPIEAEYGLYKKVLSEQEMRGATVNNKTGVISKGKETIGIRISGKNYRGFSTPSRKIEIYAKDFERYGFDPLPVWKQVPWHQSLRKEELVLITFKRSQHNMSMTANTKWLSEIAHSNPAWINKETANDLGIKDGDLVRITSAAGYMVTRARVTESIHPRAIAVPSSSGHKALGRVATAHPHGESHEGSQGHDRDIEHNLWWRDKGVNPNDIIPVTPDPVTGVQTWSDTVVSVIPALKEDTYGDIKVHNGKHFDHYKEMLKYAHNGERHKKVAKAS
jgi:thiosulfate reductase/polysulfide reductase chain A